ncbi:MAG: 4-hydroxybenzoate polyprenyltransferase [Deltaproteobacteria bacterium GWA2_55_10]|nr:MAG: 4-hydroxybenzoate polyprenyltransferase [Deltaproteobacteria bacterium GWA2_55_10]
MVSALSIHKLRAISDLMRLPRQQGTLLLLWPTLWSLFIAADGRPDFNILAIFVAGTFLMRSAGCIMNDIADRGFDPHVERTKDRPLANKRLNVIEAIIVMTALSAAAFALVLQLNRLTIMLSFVGIALAAIYPFVKRFSHFPQVVLGMAFGWGAVMAWSAVRDEISLVPILIFLANIFWATAYDTIYALMDKDDDLRIGVKSTAIFFGSSVYKALSVCYICFAVLLGGAASLMALGPVFWAGLAITLLLLLAVVAKVKKNPTRQTAFKGFEANALLGGIILLFISIDMNL